MSFKTQFLIYIELMLNYVSDAYQPIDSHATHNHHDEQWPNLIAYVCDQNWH